MEPDKIFDDIFNLPPEAQRQVFDLIIFLKKRYQRSKQKTQNKVKNIVDEPFIGMWKDREDLSNSGKWIRNIRKTEWGTTN